MEQAIVEQVLQVAQALKLDPSGTHDLRVVFAKLGAERIKQVTVNIDSSMVVTSLEMPELTVKHKFFRNL